MNADNEFLKLVREYLEVTKSIYTETYPYPSSVLAAERRRKLDAAVQEILQRQSQPGLWEDGK